MATLPLLKALGLNFSPNQLEVAPGSLVEASNVIIRRDDVIESRRGYGLYGTAMGTSSDRCKQLLTYKKKIIRHFSDRFQFENGLNNAGIASFFDFNEIVNGVPVVASIQEAETGLRIKATEANGNFYFTTSDGIKKISAKSDSDFVNSDITEAGGIKALDTSAFLNVTLGNQSGFLPSDSGVAYKILWGSKDSNGLLVLGTPSDPVTILNPLLDLILKDFSNLLLQINNVTNFLPKSTLLTDLDYYSLALPISASSIELKDNLVSLSEKLDEDLLFATDGGAATAYEPLNINTATVSSGTVTIAFTTATAADYFSAGDKINMPIDPATAILGFTSGGVTIDGINTNQIITTVAASSIQFAAKDYTVNNPNGISGAITNIPTAVAGPVILTSTNHGLKNSQSIIISGSNSTPAINGTYTVSNVTANTFQITVAAPITVAGTSASWNIVIDGFTTATIESYEFRSIAIPEDQSIPATNDQLVSLQNYFSDILLTLQDFIANKSNKIVSTSLYSSYLEQLNTTSSATVTLTLTIPPKVLQYTAPNNPFFYQAYRTDISPVTGVSSISDLEIIQEYTQIEEKFPTSAEFTSGIISFTDNTPESIAGTGANLYTNERSGEGGLQANDVPPFALDVNEFKGYTFFSNTKTRQRKTLTLLGVVNMISNFNLSNPYKLTISNGTTTNTYKFITGLTEVNELSCGAAAGFSSSGVADYFIINSANDEASYYVWFKVGSATEPDLSANKTGIQISVNAADSTTVVADKTKDAIKNTLGVFISDLSVTVTVVGSTFNAVGHGFSNNDEITLFSTGELPKDTNGDLLSSDRSYFVVNSAANTFEISEVSGGATISLSTTGSGTIKALGPSSTSSTVFINRADVGNVTDNPALSQTFLPADVNTATDVITITNHGYSDGFSFRLSSTGGLPGGLVAATPYYIVSSTANTFKLSASSGGSAIDLTTAGTGVHTIRSMPSSFSLTELQEGRGENVSNKEILISPDVSVAIAIEETAKSLIRIINRNQDEFINAFYISGTSTSPGTILLESQDIISDSFYIMGSDSTIGLSFNPDLSPGSVPITNISIANPTVITAMNHGLLNGEKIVISNSNSIPSIDGVYTITHDGISTFKIPVDVTGLGTQGAFEPTSISEVSSNEEKANRVYYSKFQQPESVPILNFLDVGVSDKKILRIFPLRDSLFVFKEDGLYRISGEVTPFSVALFDSSCILTAPDSLSVANNQLYGWTTQGISTATEAGVSVISRPIDTEILKKASSQFVNFKSATWGVGYESDNSYTVYTTSDTNDSSATIGFRYSNLTNTWTTVDKMATSGIINSSDDKLYLGAGDTNFIEKERKDFTRFDYADRELSFDITGGAVANDVISLSSVSGLSIGDVVVQDQTLTVFEFNSLLEKLDIDPGLSDSDYFSTLSAQSGDDLRAKLVALAAKLDIDATSGYSAEIVSSTGVVTTADIANPTVVTTSAAHSLKTGRRIVISGNTQSNVNGNFSVTVTAINKFTIPVDLLYLGTGGAFATLNGDFEDIKVCFNLIIARLNADPLVSFNNYKVLDNNTIQEAIIIGINTTLKKITVNSTLEFIVGDISIFKAIPCDFTYSPLTLGDPLGLKHLRESTMMFSNKAFTRAIMEFSTDLLPEIMLVEFNGDGNGIFGHQPFGSGFFGGASNAAPFRTFIPRQCQRCRYINIGFNHKTAREIFSIYGITVTGEVGQSSKAYR